MQQASLQKHESSLNMEAFMKQPQHLDSFCNADHHQSSSLSCFLLIDEILYDYIFHQRVGHTSLLHLWHTKYVEGYIVFVFPSVP